MSQHNCNMRHCVRPGLCFAKNNKDRNEWNNALCYLVQNPLTLMSALVSSDTLALHGTSTLAFSGVSCSSTPTC